MYIYEIYHVVLHADFMYFYVLCQKWRIKHVQSFKKGYVLKVNELSQSFMIVLSLTSKQQGAVSIRKTVLPGMAIPMLKIRRPNGRLIFNMEITIRR